MKADNTIKSIIKSTLRSIKGGRAASAEQKEAAARWLERLDEIEAVATAPSPAPQKPAA